MQTDTIEQPTLARQILDLEPDATDVFIGMVASHFATATALDRDTVARYVEESLAVAK
jgi:hypothetical protein